MREFFFIFLFVCLSIVPSIAQKIDNLASFHDIPSTKYIRFHYDNDLFVGTDKDYTQGFSIEFVAPILEKNPVNYFFYKPEKKEIRFGLNVEHNSFTPNRYHLPDIQFEDRPFAASLILKSFMISTDTIKSWRFTSSFIVGMIGKVAFGEEIQVGIHKATNSETPLGWGNQIHSDIVLNYEIGYEKQLIRYRDLLSIQANTNGKVGTLYTNSSIGISASIGILNFPFSSIHKKKKFSLYIYAQPLINLIAYDATLQGGAFSRNSPYSIPSGNIERITGQLNYGIVMKTKMLYFEYSGAVITREFKTGSSAKWGGFKVGLLF